MLAVSSLAAALPGLGLFAHGGEARGELPIELWQFTWLATFLLLAGFFALSGRWTTPRLTASGPPTRSIPASAIWLWAGRLLGLAVYLLALTAGIFGLDSPRLTITNVTITVGVWAVLQVLSALLGGVYRVLNPFETLALIVKPAEPREVPGWAAWLAPALLAGFLFILLVHPFGASPRILGWAMIIYSAIMVGGLVRYGRNWLDSADSFGVLFGLQARTAPHRFTRIGAAGVSLAGTVTLLVAIGGGTFDGLKEKDIWTDQFPGEPGWDGAPELLVGLLFVTGVLALLYATAVRFLDEPVDFTTYAPVLIPITAAYALSHYFQLIIDDVQTFWFRLSDPYGERWDLFGSAAGHVNEDWISGTAIAWVQAIAILVGHVAALVVAHDISLRTFGDNKRALLRAQYVTLLLVVGFALLGLWVLLPEKL